jgi:hypothetical protein
MQQHAAALMRAGGLSLTKIAALDRCYEDKPMVSDGGSRRRDEFGYQ